MKTEEEIKEELEESEMKVKTYFDPRYPEGEKYPMGWIGALKWVLEED